ncbi:protocadherin beta-14-like [Heptranchias perlo]|uniref:protocadherin beta-14-like n=1 Tax=Heptranchias perlo TaxID=212740 RepID=UPI003559C049
MASFMNRCVSQWQCLYLIVVYISNSVCGNIRYSISEELELGAFVGNIANDLRLDVNQLSARRFRTVTDHKTQYLDVNLNTGALFIKEKIDREQLCEQRLTCVLMLEAVMENPLKLYSFEVEILDINDNPPVFQKSQMRLEISESASPGTRFRLQNAHDRDAGTNSVRTYEISQNEHFVLELRRERIVAPELVLQRPLDREQQPTHQLTLTAIDGGTPQRSGTTLITINVFDINDNAPVFEQSVYQITIAENVPKDTLIMKLNALDMDEGQNGEIIYSFSDHTPDRVRNTFSLDSRNGEIRVTGTVDFEEAHEYQICVEAKDRGPDAAPVYCEVLLKIADVNDNAPEIIVSSMSSPIPENASLGTAVALLKVTDRDSEERGDVTCHISKNTPFKLDSSFNNYYTLVVDGDIDREEVSDYKINISCTDAGSPPLSSYRTIPIELSDINDNTPSFMQPSFTMHVTENNAVGKSIGSVPAFDPDSDQNAYLTYTILDTFIHGMPTSTFTSISSANGVMFAQRSFDYEQIKKFQVHVQVKDAGSPPLNSTITVNVIIVDQNDNVPVILLPLSNRGSSAEETMPRSADPGYLVAKVTATDADSGQNAQLYYQLLQPTDESLFTVSPETGEIWTIRRFGIQSSRREKIVILVRDNGKPSLSSTTTINLTVLDEDTENPSNVGMLANPGRWTSDLRRYLIISFGTISIIFLLPIIILSIKVHKGRNAMNGHRCSWTIPFSFLWRNSSRGIEKASINLPIPPHYADNETASETFRYDVCQTLNSDMKDFMFVKLHGPTAPTINIKTGACMASVNGNASDSIMAVTTESHESAHEPEAGTNRVHTYQLSKNEHFTLELQTDGEQTVTAELVLERPLDREHQPIQQSTLTAIDGETPVSLVHGMPAPTFFTIISANGMMFAQRSFDYEQLKNVQVFLDIMDTGSPRLNSYVTVNMIIVDQNKNAPVILSPLSNRGSVAEETMPRSADPGYLVAKVTATDADSGQNAKLHYQFLQPIDESLGTGHIWTIRRFGIIDLLKKTS